MNLDWDEAAGWVDALRNLDTIVSPGERAAAHMGFWFAFLSQPDPAVTVLRHAVETTEHLTAGRISLQQYEEEIARLRASWLTTDGPAMEGSASMASPGGSPA